VNASLGATLRLLRLEAGLGLRDLARRIGVSSTYLSRVENGFEAPPTSQRLEAMARELGVASTFLVEIARRVNPFLVDYVEQEPEAGSLFLEIAQRHLGREQLAEIRAFIDERFPAVARTRPRAQLSELLAKDRIVVGLRCGGLDDVLDVAAQRLGSALDHAAVARSLRERESEVSSAIGGGVAVPCAYVEGASPSAALVTLARPLRTETPDGAPLQLVIVLCGAPRAGDRIGPLASIARLASRGLAGALDACATPAAVLSRLAQLELLA